MTGQRLTWYDWHHSWNQPNNVRGVQDCLSYLYYFVSRGWHDDECYRPNGAICENHHFEIIYSLCEGIIHSFDFVLCWNYPNWDQCITLGRCWYAPTRICSQGCCRWSGIGCFCRFPDASFRQKLEIKQLANFIVNGRWFFFTGITSQLHVSYCRP